MIVLTILLKKGFYELLRKLVSLRYQDLVPLWEWRVSQSVINVAKNIAIVVGATLAPMLGMALWLFGLLRV